MNNNAKYYLAIDWGTKKIGLAIADDETRIASALKTARASEVANYILDLSKKIFIDKIIVGDYLKKDKFRKNSKQIQAFIDEIKKTTNIEIERAYEGFSSKIAQRNLRQKGAGSGSDDAESARIILQGWLDGQH